MGWEARARMGWSGVGWGGVGWANNKDAIGWERGDRGWEGGGMGWGWSGIRVVMGLYGKEIEWDGIG